MSVGFGLHSLSSQCGINSVADAVRHSQLLTVTSPNWDAPREKTSCSQHLPKVEQIHWQDMLHGARRRCANAYQRPWQHCVDPDALGFVKSVISKYVEVLWDNVKQQRLDRIRNARLLLMPLPRLASSDFNPMPNPITADKRSKFSASSLGLLWRKAFENRPTNSRWELVSRLWNHRIVNRSSFSLDEREYIPCSISLISSLSFFLGLRLKPQCQQCTGAKRIQKHSNARGLNSSFSSSTFECSNTCDADVVTRLIMSAVPELGALDDCAASPPTIAGDFSRDWVT